MPDAPAPSSEEKALADKLMEELKASGVDVEALQKAEGAAPTVAPAAAPVPAPAAPAAPPPSPAVDSGAGVAPPPAPTPTPTPTPPPPPAAAPTPAPIPAPVTPKKEKKKLSLKLPFGKKAPAAPPPPPPEPATDPETTQITHQALITMIDDKLKKISGDDFITIRISKSGMLILSGLILLLIWLSPIIVHGFKQIDFSKFTKTPIATDTSPKIRLRLGFDSLETAQTLETLLKTAGYTNIETIKDESIASNAAQIATKDGQTDLNQKLAEVLSQHYQISTDSSVLTQDSDFDAAILIGPQAPKK